MPHNPHRLIRLAGAAVLTLSLAACGGALAPGSSNNEANDSAGPVSTTVPGKDVTLKIAVVDAPDMVKKLAVAYHKKHPNVTIKTQYTQFDDYVKNIKLTMSSDTAPDIAQFNSGAMQSIIAAGLLRNLDPYSKAYQWKGAFPAIGLQQLSTDKTGKTFGTGSLYAVPAGMSLVGVFYNKKLASKAGITAPPKTFADFEKDLAKAKKAGQQPLAVGALDTGALHVWAELVNINMPLDKYRTWVYGRDGGTIKTPGAKAATEKIQEWAQKGYIPKSANGTSENDSAAHFRQGAATFTVNGNWEAAKMAKSMGSNVGFFAMPPKQPGGTTTGNGYSVSYALSSKSDHPNVAANFLDFLHSAKAAKIESEGGFLPANAEAAPEVSGVLGDLSHAYQKVVEDDGIQQFPDASAPAMLDKLQSGLQKVLAGRMEPDAFLTSLQQTWESYHK